jgi:hypothetical protein
MRSREPARHSQRRAASSRAPPRSVNVAPCSAAPANSLLRRLGDMNPAFAPLRNRRLGQRMKSVSIARVCTGPATPGGCGEVHHDRPPSCCPIVHLHRRAHDSRGTPFISFLEIARNFLTGSGRTVDEKPETTRIPQRTRPARLSAVLQRETTREGMLPDDRCAACIPSDRKLPCYTGVWQRTCSSLCTTSRIET